LTGTAMTAAAATARLAGRLAGHLLAPGDPGYDAARTIWNAMIDHRPRLIVRCASTADVVAAVRLARDLGLDIGVRCGGHSFSGLSVPDGGLMIDLTLMGAVRVDPGRRRAWVQGGALLGALDQAALACGLATTAGNVSHTGVGGLTLGGGMGWLARQFGLTCDNLLGAEVVTASGAVVRASAQEHPDLLWGLRGGGGNFGIVTEFEFRLHPVSTAALVAEYTFPVSRALPALLAWRELSARAPRPATFTAAVSGDAAVLGFVWAGDPAAGRRLLPGLRALGRPAAERVTELSYAELQRRDDSVRGHAWRRYVKGHYLPRFPDAAAEAFLGRGAPGAAGDGLPDVSLQAYGGAIADAPEGGAAFSHRGTLLEYVASARWSDPAQDQAAAGPVRAAAAALQPFASGVYVNVLTDEGAAGLRRAYPPGQLARLTELKTRLDPDNVFHLNHNIAPAAGR
jgi:FAD/FMN-containing dehydrogenase